MKNKAIKISVFVGFMALFVGSALFMYFKYIHNKPKIEIIAPKTEINPMQFDSLLYEQNKDKKLK